MDQDNTYDDRRIMGVHDSNIFNPETLPCLCPDMDPALPVTRLPKGAVVFSPLTLEAAPFVFAIVIN